MFTGMASKVLFVTPTTASAGYFVSLSDGADVLELVAVKSQASVYVDAEAAHAQRDTIMRARRPDGRHWRLASRFRMQSSSPLP